MLRPMVRQDGAVAVNVNQIIQLIFLTCMPYYKTFWNFSSQQKMASRCGRWFKMILILLKMNVSLSLFLIGIFKTNYV